MTASPAAIAGSTVALPAGVRSRIVNNVNGLTIHTLEAGFKEMAAAAAIKPGELLLPLRVMLVGGKFGPHVFDIAALLGRQETTRRVRHVLGLLK